MDDREAASMRPTVPIFPQLSTGSVPHDYLNRARQFQTAATCLVSYANGQINWPSYALYEIAEQHGLVLPTDIAPALDELEDMHAQHWARYPDNRTGPILDVSVIASELVEGLMNAVSVSFQKRPKP
jgi:hypothetical protein